MIKNFDVWNDIKKELDLKNRDLFFKEGEVWWCSVGLNIGVESCGKGNTFRRPVLILKKLSNYSFIGLPLSSQIKKGTWFTDVEINNEKQCVLLYQIRMYSKNRFQRRFATLDSNDLNKVKEKLDSLLELSDNHQSTNSGSVGIPKSNISIDHDEKKSTLC